MKKFVLIAIVIVLAITMMITSGCSLRTDNLHATAEITTSTGEAKIVNSANGAGMNKSGAEIAVHSGNKIIMPEGETATVHFFCNACGHDETVEITAPFAKLFQCDCPEKISEEGHAKEYVSVIAVTQTETPAE